MEQRHRNAINEFISDRTPRPLMGPLLKFDLSDEAARLRTEAPWLAHGHNARTLIKHSEFRLVLIALNASARIHEQQVFERIAIHTLRGKLRLRTRTEVLELHAGTLSALDRREPFSIEALEESELLLWLGWSKEDPKPGIPTPS